MNNKYTGLSVSSFFSFWKDSFNSLSQTIPTARGWFGVSASKVLIAGTKLIGQSTISTILVSIAKEISEWTYSVKELAEGMFLDSVPSDRYIEHLRNTYIDYGLYNLYNTPIAWTKNPTESSEDYINRIQAIQADILFLFKKQSITKGDLESAIKSIDPTIEVEIFEPYTLTKPWPGPKQYIANRLPNETDEAWVSRLSNYDQKYKELKSKNIDSSLKTSDFKTYQANNKLIKPNTNYPIPAENNFTVGNITESDAEKNSRKSLLKLQLGSYNNLGGTVSRRFFSERNRGGRVEITVSKDVPGLVEKIGELKAAGVQVLLFIQTFLGTAERAVNTNNVMFLQPIDLVLQPGDLMLPQQVDPDDRAIFV